ncbi:hypothetical protein MSG28_008260 [Choristoneura fumiferana]|uniref:Uncharacterized protein n=1 Tax=Choristoneura fumiferana TaxID=7141 RepID=A0ACC0JAN2_CHOFU|nr:hypothetical protein MSG28_008260 [Choristoneura fumiferana]
MELARFYLQPRRDPHGPTLALFVASLPPGLSERNYENILVEFLGADNKFTSIGPIYYEYGSMVITYEDASKAVRALYALREAKYEDKHLLVGRLPGARAHQLLPEAAQSLPGLRSGERRAASRILVCGGDGTIGWVLQCLDNVGQDSQCSNPPCAIVPLGTGNDLARVLRWGPGYTGGEDPLSLLRDVIDAEEIRLDRWTVILVMNNYFGIGIDADLCLDFHNAREENPNKFNSSWGSGANPWGPEKDDQFSKPNHWDGMLEVVGVTGVGGHIKINLKSEIPVQVDGEPWVAAPSEVVVLKSALKVPPPLPACWSTAYGIQVGQYFYLTPKISPSRVTPEHLKLQSTNHAYGCATRQRPTSFVGSQRPNVRDSAAAPDVTQLKVELRPDTSR